ncbi:TonB-dependent receptor [Parvibaculum sp.]|uniref:TonB-dependent receptor n=1 Tax=Parvibaculum sp. TaxID=2024848 RepID=UPI002CD2B235|nr:TonB-dependent receptor [Parvibaculum sp.]HUD49876.1 TonB-dependent receptor [Parvibaculum sp.]
MKYVLWASAAVAALGAGVMSASAAEPAASPTPTTVETPAAVPPTKEASQGVEEIVVTAQKRTENVQKVPVAITVVTGEQLKDLHITEPSQIKYAAPSVQFVDANSSRTEGFAVRGIGTFSFAPGIEQSVATVLDGVVLGRTGAGLGDFADVSRVEVLRGPQGMLFGKNASAGLVQIITNQPELGEYSGNAHVSYGSYNERHLQGTVNVPVSDDSALRLTGYESYHDGTVNNKFNGEDLNDKHEYGLKGKYLWKPTNDFSLYAIGDWSHSHANCCVWTQRENIQSSLAPFLTNYLYDAQIAAGITPGPKNGDVSLNGPVFTRVSAGGGSVEMNWTPGEFTFTSISAYRFWKEQDGLDADGTSLSLMDDNRGHQSQKQFSQELRLTSPAGKFIDYVAGLYYWHQEVKGGDSETGDAGVIISVPSSTFLPGVSSIIDTVTTEQEVKTNSYAAFGQGTVHVADDFRLIAGGRLTRDELKLDFVRDSSAVYNLSGGGSVTGPSTGFGILYVTPYAFSAETSNNNFSWKLGAQYDFTKDVMGYATVSRGYKGPGIGALNYYNPANDTAIVKPEIPTSYELGLKSALFNRKLVLNAAVFQATYKDFQAQINDGVTPPVGSKIVNASKLETQGVELDFMARPVEGLTLTGAATYVNANFGENCNCNGDPSKDPSGKMLPGTPRWSYTIAGMYERPVLDELTGFVGLNWYWRSQTHYSADPDPAIYQATTQSSYGLLGGTIGVGSDNWRLSLYGRNLLDKRFNAIFTTLIPSVIATQSPTGYSQFTPYEAYRTVGVGLDVSF